MNEKIEKESMKKFFQYIKAQNYAPGREGYSAPSSYYPRGYPYPSMTVPSKLNIPASNTEQNQHPSEDAERPINTYAQYYYKHGGGMYGYPGYPNMYGMPPPPVMAIPTTKSAQNGQASGNLGYPISQKLVGSQSGIQPISSSQTVMGYPPNSSYGYAGCPYYPYMNPYNPYGMYSSYYYNRMGQGYSGAHPPLQKQLLQGSSNIKQEIVISSDEENNPMKSELGSKINKNGYMIFQKEKNPKEKDKLKKINQEAQKIKQKEKKKDSAQNDIQRSQQKYSEYINDEEMQEDNKDKYYIKRIKEAKQKKQTNEEIKQKNKIQTEIKPLQNQMEKEEDGNQEQKQKNKKGLQESNFSPFVIKKRISKARLKNSNQAIKNEKKKIREKNQRKNQLQFKDNDLLKDRNQNQNASNKADSKVHINKTDNKKIRCQQQKKSEDKKGEDKQQLKKDKTRDDHPLKELRYSESHGKIRIGAYYQSAIPHLLSGDRVMLLRRNLQKKLRERQISALTF